MRNLFVPSVALLLALAVGCGIEQAVSDPTVYRGPGPVSMYPLSDAPVLPPLQAYSQPRQPTYVGQPVVTPEMAVTPSPMYLGNMQPIPANAPIIIPEPPVVSGAVYTIGPDGSRIYLEPDGSMPEIQYQTAPQPSIAEPYAPGPYVMSTTPAPVSEMIPPVTTYPAPEPVSIGQIQTMPAVPQMGNFADAGLGYQLVPALDVPPGNHPNDAGPSQWFEIVRPDNGPIRIGRVSSTCVCVSLRVPNRHIAAGERALVEARIVTRPPRNNLTYGIYVNIIEPMSQMLDADVTISL